MHKKLNKDKVVTLSLVLVFLITLIVLFSIFHTEIINALKTNFIDDNNYLELYISLLEFFRLLLF